MKRNNVLTVMSLLSILLLSLHLTDDIVYGSDKSAALNVVAAAVLVIWLYGTLVLAGRRSGYLIILLLSLLALAVPLVHMTGKGVGAIAGSSGGFFFIWTLIAIGVTSLFSVILAVRGLWSLPWRRTR